MNPQRKKSAKRKGASKKSREKGAQALEAQARKHREKLAAHPDSPDVPHWLAEIAAFEARAAALRRRH